MPRRECDVVMRKTGVPRNGWHHLVVENDIIGNIQIFYDLYGKLAYCGLLFHHRSHQQPNQVFADCHKLWLIGIKYKNLPPTGKTLYISVLSDNINVSFDKIDPILEYTAGLSKITPSSL